MSTNLQSQDFDENKMRVYQKKAIPVQAVVVEKDTPVQVSWQSEPLTALAGDYIVSDDASSWPVGKDIFKDTYQSNGDGTYTKVATIEAYELDQDVSVETLEGTAQGREGDFLARGVKQEIWPIPRADFMKNYEPSLDVEIDDMEIGSERDHSLDPT